MSVGDPYYGDPLGRAFRDQGLLIDVRRQLTEARQVIDRQVREIRLLRDLLAAVVHEREFTLEDLRDLGVVE